MVLSQQEVQCESFIKVSNAKGTGSLSLASCSLYIYFCVTVFSYRTCLLMQAERKINLVYGGGSVGLMGLVSRTVHEGGCHVIG